MTKRKILLAADKLNYVAALTKNTSPVTFSLKCVTTYKHGNVSDMVDFVEKVELIGTFPCFFFSFFEVSHLHFLVCRSFWERIN